MKISQKAVVSFLLLSAVSLTGCFHIVEEITLRKNGSGSYRLTFESPEFAKMVSGMTKGLETEPIPSDSMKIDLDVTERFSAPPAEDKFARLKNMRGISNVVEVNDKTTLGQGFSLDFERPEDLRPVMDSLGAEFKQFGSFGAGRALNVSGKVVRRDQRNSIRDMLARAMKQQSAEEGTPDMGKSESFMKILFGSMSFKQVYYFPDQKIKNCNHKGAVISKDKHTLTLVERPFKDSDTERKKAPSELLVRLK